MIGLDEFFQTCDTWDEGQGEVRILPLPLLLNQIRMPKHEKIQLTPKEEEYLSKINFYFSTQELRNNYATYVENSKNLFLSLMDRNAIPEIRLRYFTDPELNIGQSKKSKKEAFENNLRHGEKVYDHHSFIKYLYYFIFGSKIPESIQKEFLTIIDEEILTSGELISRLTSFSRKKAKELNWSRDKVGDEFFKLSLDCNLDSGLARLVRDAAFNANR